MTLISEAWGAGENIDDCTHAVLTLNTKTINELLKLEPVVLNCEEKFRSKFLRLELINYECEFGTLKGKGKWPDFKDEGWIQNPKGFSFTKCNSQECVVVRAETEGICFRMITDYTDESPFTDMLSWNELRNLLKERSSP
jgi:hypothetical protein